MATATRTAVMAQILSTVQGMAFPSPVNGALTWNTVGNKLKLYSDVSREQQPAAYVVTHQETSEYRGLGLLRRRLNLGIWCYCYPEETTSGADLLDTLMEAFESAFCVPDDPSTGNLTFQGMVYWCRIEGRVFKDPGDIDGQAMMIVPMVVEMP